MAGGDSKGGSSAWRVAAASVRGLSHRKAGLPCQDALEWKVVGGKLLVAALADGAGSASLAEVGAALAAGTALKTVLGKLPESGEGITPEPCIAVLKEACKAAREAVLAEAEKRDVKTRELATTLVLAAATPAFAVGVQVGDGAVVVAPSLEEARTLTKPPIREYLNETMFLTADAAIESAQSEIHTGRVSCLAVFSDGLQMLALKLPEAQPHLPFFRPLFHFAQACSDAGLAREQLSEFLGSPRIAERADDDLSLLLGVLVET